MHKNTFSSDMAKPSLDRTDQSVLYKKTTIYVK